MSEDFLGGGKGKENWYTEENGGEADIYFEITYYHLLMYVCMYVCAC
jgi:hypothetical protein